MRWNSPSAVLLREGMVCDHRIPLSIPISYIICIVFYVSWSLRFFGFFRHLAGELIILILHAKATKMKLMGSVLQSLWKPSSCPTVEDRNASSSISVGVWVVLEFSLWIFGCLCGCYGYLDVLIVKLLSIFGY